jgi:hypothetical protein
MMEKTNVRSESINLRVNILDARYEHAGMIFALEQSCKSRPTHYRVIR